MDIVPQTIWKEGRGEGHDGMVAIAFAIHNRTLDKQWSTDAEKVCLQRLQFSCWNDTDVNRDLWPSDTDPQYKDAETIWGTLDDLADPTEGATFYLNPQSVKVNPFDMPAYIRTAVIGKHWFYRKSV